MKLSLIVLIISILNISQASVESIKPAIGAIEVNLLQDYMKIYSSKKELAILKKKTIAQSGKAVPILVKVMKSSKYPEKNRWVATFLLGQIMGKKSAPFISKFIKHPNWVMRMASLKTLMALKQAQFTSLYKRTLKDKSLIVRTQALELVRKLNIREMGPSVWAMLYDKKNYYSSIKKSTKKKLSKRIGIIKTVVRTVGELKFKKALKPLLTMIQKKKYKDLFVEMDYSLGLITGKKSPRGNIHLKKRYWKRIGLSYNTI